MIVLQRAFLQISLFTCLSVRSTFPGKQLLQIFFSKSKPKLQKKCFLLDHLTTVWGGPVPILSNSFLGTENCMLVLNGLNDCIHTHLLEPIIFDFIIIKFI